MSDPIKRLGRRRLRSARATHVFRLTLALFAGVGGLMFLAPAALAKFGVKALRLGSASGAVDYLYTAGNTVVEQGSADKGRYYRFDVYDGSGTLRWSSACRPATANGTVSGSYTLPSTAPLSNTNGWRFRLREFSSAGSCGSSNSPQHDVSLYFDVAAATAYSSSALSTQQSAFKAGTTAYVQVAGVGKVSASGTNAALGVGTWSTSWILPSGSTACANTANNASDLPGSTAAGQLPDRTSQSAPALPNLQYRPSTTSAPDPWNLEANYETRPCQDFGSSDQGQWSLKLSADSTHFVKLPVFTVLTAPPDTTITSGPSNTTASTSATFTFTSSTQGSTFQCSLDGAAATPCSSPQSYSGLTAGGHTFNVAAIDPAGNVDPTPATSSWTIQTTAPAVTLTSPAAASYTNSTTPTFSGTAQTAAGDSDVTVAVYAGASATGSPIQTLSAAVQSGGTWSINASTLTEGTYAVQANQTDAASNTGYSTVRVFTVDTTPPTVTLYTPGNGTHTNDTLPQVSGLAGTAAGDLSTVTVTFTGVGSPVQVTTTASSSGAWNVTPPSGLAEGNYTIQAAQQDQAGNTGYSYSHITIDTTPPQTFLDTGPVGTTSSSTAIFSFHDTDALSPAGSTFQCQLDGGAWTTCSSPQYYYNLADGAHTFSVEAIDGAGNVDNTGQTASWTVNTTLPAVTLDSPSENSYTSNSTPTFSGTAGTAAGDSSVQVLVYASTDLAGSPVQTLTASVAGDGSWSAIAAALPDGTYVAYAQQSNAAGTATSVAHMFTVNTQPPTTTITLGPPGNSGTGTANFSFSSSEPGSTFQCQLDGAGWTACSSPQHYTGLSNGFHTFQVRAIDPAGNVGTPASQTWTVNTNLPALSLTSPSDGTVTNNPVLSISGHGGTAAGDASTVTVQIYSGTSTAGSPLESIVTTVSSGTGAWSTHPSPTLADGNYTVYAQQVGAAGTAYTQADTFTIDTIAPTTTITSGPQGATSATTARFAFSSSAAGSTFECQLDGGAWTACTSPQSYSSLSVGTHTFSVRATDPAGNVDPNPPFQAWTIDSTVPVTLTAPTDDTVTNNNTPTFAGAASAANGAITVEIDDSSGNPVEFLTASAASSWSVSASPALPDGTYVAFASQLGSDGVTTDYSNVIGFTVDTTPPSVTLTSAPAGAISTLTPSFGGAAGTAGGDLGVKLRIYSGASASGTPVQTVSATTSGGGWSATASALATGTYTARAEQSDTAGNTGYSAARTFTVQASPPTTTITSGPPSSTTATTASFSFTSSAAGSTFECQLDGGAWTACTSPQSYSSLGLGAHTFSVRATDPAGNVDPAPPSQSWTITQSASGSPPPSGGTPPTGSAPPTTPTLQFLLSAKAKQRVGRKHSRGLALTIQCKTSCTVVVSGVIVISPVGRHARKAKSTTLRSIRLVGTKAAAGKQVKLTFKLPARIRKLILAALSKRLHVTLKLTGLASVPGLKPVGASAAVRLLI